MTGTAFDQLAEQYDTVWTTSAIGRFQRRAVWRRIDPLVAAGDSILDLGCGTGEDALHLMARGAEVYGIDASAEMINIARRRGVPCQRLALESISDLTGRFDGAISNFGALNCIDRLEDVAVALGRLIRPGGYLAICLMGICCLWEIHYFLSHGHPSKALRRWRREGSTSSLGIHVRYPSIKSLTHVFRRDFKLTGWYGVGLSVPPSYVNQISERTIARLARVDERIAHWPLFRALSDHRLLIFERL